MYGIKDLCGVEGRIVSTVVSAPFLYVGTENGRIIKYMFKSGVSGTLSNYGTRIDMDSEVVCLGELRLPDPIAPVYNMVVFPSLSLMVAQRGRSVFLVDTRRIGVPMKPGIAALKPLESAGRVERIVEYQSGLDPIFVPKNTQPQSSGAADMQGQPHRNKNMLVATSAEDILRMEHELGTIRKMTDKQRRYVKEDMIEMPRIALLIDNKTVSIMELIALDKVAQKRGKLDIAYSEHPDTPGPIELVDFEQTVIVSIAYLSGEEKIIPQTFTWFGNAFAYATTIPPKIATEEEDTEQKEKAPTGHYYALFVELPQEMTGSILPINVTINPIMQCSLYDAPAINSIPMLQLPRSAAKDIEVFSEIAARIQVIDSGEKLPPQLASRTGSFISQTTNGWWIGVPKKIFFQTGEDGGPIMELSRIPLENEDKVPLKLRFTGQNTMIVTGVSELFYLTSESRHLQELHVTANIGLEEGVLGDTYPSMGFQAGKNISKIIPIVSSEYYNNLEYTVITKRQNATFNATEYLFSLQKPGDAIALLVDAMNSKVYLLYQTSVQNQVQVMLSKSLVSGKSAINEVIPAAKNMLDTAISRLWVRPGDREIEVIRMILGLAMLSNDQFQESFIQFLQCPSLTPRLLMKYILGGFTVQMLRDIVDEGLIYSEFQGELAIPDEPYWDSYPQLKGIHSAFPAFTMDTFERLPRKLDSGEQLFDLIFKGSNKDVSLEEVSPLTQIQPFIATSYLELEKKYFNEDYTKELGFLRVILSILRDYCIVISNRRGSPELFNGFSFNAETLPVPSVEDKSLVEFIPVISSIVIGAGGVADLLTVVRKDFLGLESAESIELSLESQAIIGMAPISIRLFETLDLPELAAFASFITKDLIGGLTILCAHPVKNKKLLAEEILVVFRDNKVDASSYFLEFMPYLAIADEDAAVSLFLNPVVHPSYESLLKIMFSFTPSSFVLLFQSLKGLNKGIAPEEIVKQFTNTIVSIIKLTSTVLPREFLLSKIQTWRGVESSTALGILLSCNTDKVSSLVLDNIMGVFEEAKQNEPERDPSSLPFFDPLTNILSKEGRLSDMIEKIFDWPEVIYRMIVSVCLRSTENNVNEKKNLAKNPCDFIRDFVGKCHIGEVTVEGNPGATFFNLSFPTPTVCDTKVGELVDEILTNTQSIKGSLYDRFDTKEAAGLLSEYIRTMKGKIKAGLISQESGSKFIDTIISLDCDNMQILVRESVNDLFSATDSKVLQRAIVLASKYQGLKSSFTKIQSALWDGLGEFNEKWTQFKDISGGVLHVAPLCIKCNKPITFPFVKVGSAFRHESCV